MIQIRQHIPNAITCLNLFSGCLACVMAFRGNYEFAAYFIYLAAVFDFLDGFAARLLKAYSAMGKELDSLADVVSFGLAPGIIMFSLFQDASFNFLPQVLINYIPYVAFLIPVFSALRLAKFNVDERQTSSFIGLPTPANSIFFASLSVGVPCWILDSGIFLLFIVVLFSYLLVSELPMFSLKFKNLHWKQNAIQYLFLLFSFLVIFFMGIHALYIIIIFYIFISSILVFVQENKK